MWAALEAEDSVWNKREEQVFEVGAEVLMHDSS